MIIKTNLDITECAAQCYSLGHNTETQLYNCFNCTHDLDKVKHIRPYK